MKPCFRVYGGNVTGNSNKEGRVIDMAAYRAYGVSKPVSLAA